MLDPAQFVELKASGNLPSPKGAALKVIELCQRDNVTLPEIIQVLQIDPAMVGRILKLANSAAFGRPRPAAALTPDVLMSIGIQSVRQVVLAFSLVSGNRHGNCPGFDYEIFWSRSAASGVATQLLGAATRAAPPAEMFTVGLLANIGRMALAALHAERYGELMARAGGQFSPALTALEQKAFGHTHLDVAAAMMRDWGLPKLFTDAVLFHEAPQLADFAPESRSGQLTHCLHLGAQLADLCFVPQAERAAGFAKLLAPARELGIADGNLAALGDQMLREWKDWSALLELGVREVTPFSALEIGAENQDPSTQEASRHLNILVVDDDPTVCLLLRKLLTGAGHTVHVAKDGH
ncbi:MAG: HDOD domain-containing protein, partial [Gallionellaceae bacterium]|nr:HDOD domain-containing protein [Gallionellaceae bacterium]